MPSPNKNLIQQFVTAINARDMVVIERLTSPAVAQMVRQMFDWVDTVWPDVTLAITDIIEEGDQVWCRVHTAGTQIGEWENIPASPDAGKRWENPGVWFARVKDGKVVALEMLFDALNHIKQLGGKVTI
jgi:predicted ester cyclase